MKLTRIVKIRVNLSGALISATLISVILIPYSGYSPDILDIHKTLAFLHLGRIKRTLSV